MQPLMELNMPFFPKDEDRAEVQTSAEGLLQSFLKMANAEQEYCVAVCFIT